MHTSLRIGAIVLLLAPATGAQQPAPTAPHDAIFGDLHWRNIGPYRGGRTKSAVGVAQQPSVFYLGAVNGGVWKSNDFGRTWNPIFDDQPTGSIGAIAVAPSDPNIVYVGSGEGLQRPDLSTGDGIYKSADAGRTWTHLGLRDGQQIPQIAVDPTRPERLFVAVLGHPYGPNEERAVFRSTDGGRSFNKVLYKDADTGAIDVAIDPSNASHVYAVLWEARQGPWENGAFRGPNSGLYESDDGGDSWHPLTKGLPTFEQGLGRIGIAIAPSDPKRMYAAVQSDVDRLYRSDDAGQSWYKATDDDRVVTRGDDFAEVKVSPKDPDVVFTASVVSWKSTDGGKTFHAFRGAPGGDDYQRIWINPNDPAIMIIGSDQGAIVTVNGGESWSSWYNQSTAQFYHVSTDNAFPYRVCGGQQESGSACVASRSDDGRITYRDWHPVAVEEYGYVAPDPLDPDLVYGGKVSRYNRKTGQVIQVGPEPAEGIPYRTVRTLPVLFSPIDPHILYFASNTVWMTRSGGLQGWTRISPDLTRKTWEVPKTVGVYMKSEAAQPTQRGVIYALAPSPLDINTIWAGTDDGLIQVTRDGGKTWTDVTPPALTPWEKISVIEASHSDVKTAYAAVNTLRLDDLRPHILRTRDGGKTWTEIVHELPAGATINSVREDPKKKGLLFAGSETQVWASFDDGDHWASLRQNMPATSIRDLTIKGDDLIAATHGRGFWILDSIAALRQIDVKTHDTDAVLFKPSPAYRVEFSTYPDTPLPPDEAGGQNPPDGAIIDYYLKAAATGPVTLEILDSAGKTIRTYSSEDPVPPVTDTGNVPAYWIRPTAVPSAAAGLHRFVWDLHYPSPPGVAQDYPISATPHETVAEPRGPWVTAGTGYRVKLTANGHSFTQPLTVKMDPRVKTGVLAQQAQFALAKKVYDALVALDPAIRAASGDRAKALSAMRDRLVELYPATQAANQPPPAQLAAAVRKALSDYVSSVHQ